MKFTFIYPNQLFEIHPCITKKRRILLIQDPLFFGDQKYAMKFHKIMVVHTKTNTRMIKSNFTNFEDYVNPSSIIWQQVETDYWKKYLKANLEDFVSETNSSIAKKIIENFDTEVKNFKQICPIEMLDKLENPISLKTPVKKAS